MIELYRDTHKSMKSIGEQFGVTTATVSLAVNKKRHYKDLAPDIPRFSKLFPRRKLSNDQRDEIIKTYYRGDIKITELATRGDIR